MGFIKYAEKDGTIYDFNPRSVADQFSTSTAYAVGDYAYYDGTLYRFKTAHPAGAWNSAHVDEVTVASELVSHGTDIAELKADLTAVETDIETGNLTAGTAKQLLADTGLTDKSPYLFRAMPTNADREEPVIVGGSVVWNQQAYNGNFDSSSGWRAFSTSYGSVSVENNIATLTYSKEGTGGYSFGLYQGSRASFIKTHKFLIRALVNPSFATSIKCELGGSDVGLAKPATANTWNTYEDILNVGTDGTMFIIKPAGLPTINVGDNIQFKKIVITDLTAMFGTAVADYVYALESATAGAGIAWLRKYGFFTKDYYPYTEPTFKHVEGLVSHKMVGFNQFDDATVFNGLSSVGITKSGDHWTSAMSKWVKTDVSTAITNSLKLLDGYAYTICVYGRLASGGTTEARIVIIYDDGTHEQSGIKQGSTYIGAGQTGYARITSDPTKRIYRIGFTYGSGGVQSTFDVFWMNVSFHGDGSRGGDYEPYKSHTYPLDTDVVLRGIPKLDASNNLYFDGDMYKPDGTVSRRYGIVDLGTLTWNKMSSYNYGTFTTYSPLNPIAKYSATEVKFIQNTKYESVTNATSSADGDKYIWLRSNNGIYIVIKDTASENMTADEFKASLSGKYMVYELATETTETADPYAPLQLADPYGTEEWVLDADAFPMPVGQETFYPENLRAKIEGLPWNFANLIAPTEVSNVATRNYTAGNLLIVDNILYKVTVNIANGGTITPGTNVTATTLAEIISALQ